MGTLEILKNDKLVFIVLIEFTCQLSGTVWVPLSWELSIVQSFSRVQLFATPWTVAHQVLCPWGSPGKNTAVGCHFLLQGIFPTPGLNSGRQILYHWATREAPQLLWAKAAGLLSVYSVEAEMETTASSLPLLSSKAKWAAPLSLHPIMLHRASSGQHFSIGTTEQAIFICSVWIKYKEHCAPPLK